MTTPERNCQWCLTPLYEQHGIWFCLHCDFCRRGVTVCTACKSVARSKGDWLYAR